MLFSFQLLGMYRAFLLIEMEFNFWFALHVDRTKANLPQADNLYTFSISPPPEISILLAYCSRSY